MWRGESEGARDMQLALPSGEVTKLGSGTWKLDACPMEGFNPSKVAKILGLPRGVVIPIVIALGRRHDEARVETRWRRTFEQAVVVH